MKFIKGQLIVFVILLSLIITVGCSNNNNLSSSKNVEELPPSSEPEPDEPSTPVVVQKIQNILKEATQEEKREFITEHMNIKESKGKKVSICMYYDGVTDFHYCDRAEFYVFINKSSSGGVYDKTKAEKTILNINNATYREVKGIRSGKIRKIGQVDRTAYNNCKNSNTGRDSQVSQECWEKYMGPDLRVPGTLYTGKWNKDGNVNIVTTCSFPPGHVYYNNCHDGTINMSTIGSFVVDYEGETAEVKFIDKRGIIRNNQVISYDLSDQDFEIVTEDKHFNDWCEIK